MIDFHGVTKIYKSKEINKVVIDDLTLRFPDNKNIGILGHNGAGKSTLMRLVAGAELPTRGRIHRYVNMSWPLGFAGGFNGNMTGLENARFVARMYGENPEEIVDFVESFAELGPSLKLPISTYSSGMKARLAFGVSMAIQFGCYLIDEITAVGDAKFKRKCAAVFEEKLETSNIIMISHSSGTLKKFCNAGCVLDSGQLTYYDDIEEAIERHNELQSR